MPDMSKKGQTVGETITALRKARTKEDKIKILKKNDTVALQCLLRMNYDPQLKFALPEGTPPFKKCPDPIGLAPTELRQQYKKFYVFLEGKHPTITQPKREAKFIQLLESLAAEEADILLSVKEKNLKCGLTKKIIEEVYPGLINWG